MTSLDCYWATFWDQFVSLHRAVNTKPLKIFEFIKAVSVTVLDMANAAYHDKPLIFIKAVADTVLYMINSVYHEKPLILIKAVADTVLDMINAIHHDKPLILPGLRIGRNSSTIIRQ